MMKRVIAISVVAGLLGGASAAVAESDVSLYGSLRYGVAMKDVNASWVPNKDEGAMWDLGSNRSSRWGVKGSMPAGDGMTAGFKMERAIGSVGSPSSMTARHHHVYLSGDMGTVTLGQQDAPYYGATTWDGAQTLGGATDFVFRSSGVSYASNLGGPFGFKVLVGSGMGGAEESGDGVGHVEASASLAAGPIDLSLGYFNDSDETVDTVKVHGMQRVGGTVSGNIGRINWEIGYDNGTDVLRAQDLRVRDGDKIGGDDDRYGAHIGYEIGEGGNIYTQYSAQAWSGTVQAGDSKTGVDYDLNSWLVGYSHTIAPGVVVYGEFSNTSEDMTAGSISADRKTSSAVVALKVSF